MKINLSKVASSAILAAMLGGVTAPASAANWLMLQGTEPAGSAPRAKVWGFIQAQYQEDYSDACAANCNPTVNTVSNGYIPPKLIGPNLDSQSQFAVNRARIGVRGTGMPLDSNVNYFLLAEFGENAITNASNSSTHVTDASITLNQIPGMRVRMGLFKFPGAEEALQAIHTFDYVNFSEVSNQLMLERFQTSMTGNNVPPRVLNKTSGPGAASLNTYDLPVGAYRDTGIQLFDTFKGGDWEHSYAFMIGNGNGLSMNDNDDNKDTYVYWSSEKVYGGKGPRRQGMKVFAWSHSGKRTFDGDADGTTEEYDRKRSGVGFKYLKGQWRATAEYMRGEGMIFNGPDKSTYGLTSGAVGVPASAANGLLQEASGWYMEGGWYIPNSNWELDLRHDVYNRLNGGSGAFELEFVTTTYGVQYHFNKKSRFTFNYASRSAEAVKFGAGAGPNVNLDGVGDRLAVQVTHIF